MGATELAAVGLIEISTSIFFYVVIAAYVAFLVASALEFSRRREPGRPLRSINLTLVPLGVMIALVGVLAASFNGFLHEKGPPSTEWATVMVALGLGGASFVLAVEGLVVRSRLKDKPVDRRAVSLRSLSLVATTIPLLILGAFFLAFATCPFACH